MSSCSKDFHEYEIIKKCFKCGNVSLKSNFRENKKDGLQPICKVCVNDYNKNY